MRHVVLAMLMLVCSAASVVGAEINASTSTDSVPIITISGEFAMGDEERFNALAIPLKQAIVILDSPGGKAYPAMEIGRTISIKNFGTAALPNGLCSSACALTWLAGRPRILYPTSRVGFHALYEMTNGNADVSSSGNALVGQYFQQLGLSTGAIVFATSAPPDGMNWLNDAKAREIGLEVKVLDEAPKTANADPSLQQTPSSDQGSLPMQSSTRDWAILPYTDLPGADLPGMPLVAITAEECRAQCEARNSCLAFTFNEQHQACFLKSTATMALQFTGAISGYVRPQVVVTRIGKDHGAALRFQTNIGSEIVQPPAAAYRNASLAWCQDKCVSTKWCQGFNYYGNQECRLLKRSKPTQKNPGAFSGVRLK